MAAQSQTSVAVNGVQKEAVKDAQDLIEDEVGVRPTQGEAVAIACDRLQEAGLA